MTKHSWSLTDGFGLDNLRRIEAPIPVPGPRDVLIEMRAAALNYRDLVVIDGKHGRAVQPPLVPLSDGVGRIAKLGNEVSDLAEGDRVSPCFFLNWPGGAPPVDLVTRRLGGPLDGTLTTHLVVPASAVVQVPAHLSDNEAATLPCAGLTAWSALQEPSPLRSGETVLILGSGGVALMALQLAKAAGARVIMTTSSADRAARLQQMGADMVIDRSVQPEWSRAARKATDGIGCDRVLELGGARTLNDSLKATRPGGVVILIGNVTGNEAPLFLPFVLSKRLTMQSVSVGSKQAFESMNRALAYHRIHPVVGQVFAFDDAPKAFRALDRHEGFGNICVAITGPEADKPGL
ncbi:zinc-dependent alcohol dehydrogenase family protein [Antarctobacter sp.]|uniref:zinc-dependent alcohol dehydrogenase family protein n=1 Tax=Antarctobacter sp. TaxID=1872577 RepID=UPI003A9239AA